MPNRKKMQTLPLLDYLEEEARKAADAEAPEWAAIEPMIEGISNCNVGQGGGQVEEETEQETDERQVTQEELNQSVGPCMPPQVLSAAKPNVL